MPTLLEIIIQTALPEIAKYGPAAIQGIIGIFSSSTAPTQAQWDALNQATQVTARDQMLAALKTHGIDPNSPTGQALINLTPP